MRFVMVVFCLMLLSALSGCGRNDSGGLPQGAALPSPQLVGPTATFVQPTLPPPPPPTAIATESQEVTMPTDTPPTPSEEPQQNNAAAATPNAPQPAFQTTPLAPDIGPTASPGRQPKPSPIQGANRIVQLAQADLARRQSLAIDSIEVVEVQSVTWPDGSLGCPRPGMVYPQVQIDGLLIRLRAAGQLYAYHSGNARPPFLCEEKSQGGSPAPAPEPPPGYDS